MIEGAYTNNSNTPLVCVAESLGKDKVQPIVISSKIIGLIFHWQDLLYFKVSLCDFLWLGNPVFTLFLNTYVSEAWKAKYIKSYIALAGVFAGAGQALDAVVKYKFYSLNIRF